MSTLALLVGVVIGYFGRIYQNKILGTLQDITASATDAQAEATQRDTRAEATRPAPRDPSIKPPDEEG